MMVKALPLFSLRHVSGADTSSMLCVPWLGGGSKYRRGSTDSCVSIVRGQASHLLHLLILKDTWRAPIKRVSCWHFSDVTAGLRNICCWGKSGSRDCVARLPSRTQLGHRGLLESAGHARDEATA